MAGGAIHRDGAIDQGLPAVVGGDREQPVAVEPIVERLQVIESGARRLDDVAPAVVPPVLLEPEARSGPGNELPQSRGARARVGVGLEGALHHRQERQLARHAATLELGHDLIEIELGPSEGALQVLGVVGVPAQLLIHRALTGAVFQRESGAHAIEEISVERRRKPRHLSGWRAGCFVGDPGCGACRISGCGGRLGRERCRRGACERRRHGCRGGVRRGR